MFFIRNLFDNKETVSPIAHGYKFNFIFASLNSFTYVFELSVGHWACTGFSANSRAFFVLLHSFSFATFFSSSPFSSRATNIFSWHTVYFQLTVFRIVWFSHVSETLKLAVVIGWDLLFCITLLFCLFVSLSECVIHFCDGSVICRGRDWQSMREREKACRDQLTEIAHGMMK